MGAVPLFARGEYELMNVIIKLNINLTGTPALSQSSELLPILRTRPNQQ